MQPPSIALKGQLGWLRRARIAGRKDGARRPRRRRPHPRGRPRQALRFGITPGPLSIWLASAPPPSGASTEPLRAHPVAPRATTATTAAASGDGREGLPLGACGLRAGAGSPPDRREATAASLCLPWSARGCMRWPLPTRSAGTVWRLRAVPALSGCSGEGGEVHSPDRSLSGRSRRPSPHVPWRRCEAWAAIRIRRRRYTSAAALDRSRSRLFVGRHGQGGGGSVGLLFDKGQPGH
jgi:hypothetical protein